MSKRTFDLPISLGGVSFCSTFLLITAEGGKMATPRGSGVASLHYPTMDGFRFEIAQWQSLQKMQSTPTRRGRKTGKKKGGERLFSVLRGPCSIEGKEEEGDTPRRLCLGCRFDFLRKLQLFSRSICAPIRQSRPLSVRPTDRPTVVRGREWSTMHNGPKPHSYFYGQNISGSERRRGNERSLTTLFKTGSIVNVMLS